MPSESIKCPSCSASDVLLLQGNQYRCRFCATAFVFSPDRQPPAPAVPSQRVFVQVPTKQDYSLLIGLILAGIVAMVVFGGFFLFLARGSETSPGKPAQAKVVPVPDAVKQQAGKAVGGVPNQQPAAEIKDVQYRPSAQSPRWVGRYLNTGNCRIFKPAVIISVFDQQGHRVGETTGMTGLGILEPGQEAVFAGTMNRPPQFDRFEIKPRSLEVGDPDLVWQANVTEANLVDGVNGRKNIVGTVENGQSLRLVSLQVTIFGYDSEGKPLGVWFALPSSRNLDAGEKTGFVCALDPAPGTELPSSFRYVAGSMR